MTTPQTYQNAYNSSVSGDSRANEDSRETDRLALISCAGRLNAAIADGGKDMVFYIDAVQHNQRLWTIFQVALCEPDNPLPKSLKMILLNLSKYVDRVSFRAITEFAPQLLHSLVDINRTIAKGLTPRQTAAAPTAQVAPPPPMQPPTSGSVMTSA